MTPETTQPQPIVHTRYGEVYANSRDIAAYFGKRHDHVLRDIDSVLAEGSPDLGSLMFQEVSTFDEEANRETRSFYMDRDGFALIVMGYTGKKALGFKLAYIRRFNEMEEKLRGEAPRIALGAPQTPQAPESDIGGLVEIVRSLTATVEALVRHHANKGEPV